MLPFQTSKRLGVALAEYARATQTPKGRTRMSAYPLRASDGYRRAQSETRCCRRHPLVVGDELSDVVIEIERGGEVDGIERPQLCREQRAGGSEYPIVDADQVDVSEDVTSASETSVTLVEQRTQYFRPRESAGHEWSSTP